MCRFLNIIIFLNMTLTLTNGEMCINPYVLDLRAEQIKQYLEHNSTYEQQILFLHFLLPFTITLGQAEYYRTWEFICLHRPVCILSLKI